ncbi:pyridoxal phosphate-dependent aminotransferase [Marinobacterium sediminicola]|uniref:Aminotransferase n=1 Tax=Marinobacterium sediminicola TaxID=518898 RepID=A0ABY1S3Q4_9GAMM|nr:pyridoxal phosphate-dependent aminotransferase [Marinobacterium sediminicola]ULG68892.1 pyridoxal phosphate-dependent aminotransferase [Marinobacterium sediminicola]SMR77906.1 Aspartate/methionine/tyrosine aminotransferase [Marinobacterium sediminicola]
MNRGWTERAREIDSFKVMDLLKRAAELDAAGHDVVHMEAGEPDFPTAEPILAAAQKALAAGQTRYTPAGGIPQLREAIAAFYQQRYGVSITPQQVLVTAGASGALLLAFALLAAPGSRFLLADPGYPCNRQFLRLLEARGQLVPVGPETNYQLTPELIEQHWQADTAGVLLASPSNPTGSVVPVGQLADIAATVDRLGGALIVDEIYHGLTYGFDAETVLSVAPNAVVLNSFSKYFGMTGWRLGWLVAEEAAVAEMEKMAQNLFISPATLSQYAALAAFEPQTLQIFEQRRAAFAERRDRLVSGLRELGFGIPLMPEGAFYVYADASHLTDDSYAYCWSLLEEDHVAVTPGADFGCNHPERYIRFSYTTGLDRIELALARLKQRISRG